MNFALGHHGIREQVRAGVYLRIRHHTPDIDGRAGAYTRGSTQAHPWLQHRVGLDADAVVHVYVAANRHTILTKLRRLTRPQELFGLSELLAIIDAYQRLGITR